MCLRKLSALMMCSLFAAGTLIQLPTLTTGHASTAQALTSQAIEDSNTSNAATLAPAESEGEPPALALYRIDAAQSKFMVRVFAGGPLFFKGHDHWIAIREFTGEAQLTPDSVSPASLELSVRADSLAETRDVFTEQQKQIINKEVRELVLETAKYPTITFKSTDVKGQLLAGEKYLARIGGDLTLHGVTRHIVIPAQVNLSGKDLRASGEFTINRGDYKVNATSALHGTIRVRYKLKFTFDIVAHQE
jgi:polyisoprenoid-binding protein YceI